MRTDHMFGRRNNQQMRVEEVAVLMSPVGTVTASIIREDGRSLQDGGNILVFFSVNWNLEEHQQIIERIGPTRQMQAGHDRPVFIHYILARDTVDEIVLARIETKREVQDLLLDALKRRA